MLRRASRVTSTLLARGRQQLDEKLGAYSLEAASSQVDKVNVRTR